MSTQKRRWAALQHFTRIHQSSGIKDTFDVQHQFQFERGFVSADSFTFKLPQTMFGADAAGKLIDHLINQFVDRRFVPINENSVLRRIRHGTVVMDVTIAHMPERRDTYAGKGPVQKGIGAGDKFRHATDWDRYVMFDADTFTF